MSHTPVFSQMALDQELDKLFKKSTPAPFKAPTSLESFKVAEPEKEERESKAEDAEKSAVRKTQKEVARQQEERLQRTVFIGNVPVACVKSKVCSCRPHSYF